jgi:hypothetical protein
MQPTPETPPHSSSSPDEANRAPGPPSQLPDEVAPLIAQSQEAFRRDLPNLLLLKGRGRRWVAYHGGTRLGFAGTKTELYQECLRRGLRPGEFVVRSIEPETRGEAELFVDV